MDESIKNQDTEEVFDGKLQEIFGERYHDETVKTADYKRVEDSSKSGGTWKRVKAACGLVAGVGLLYYMIMFGKIDTAFGVLFVAGTSGICGYNLK